MQFKRARSPTRPSLATAELVAEGVIVPAETPGDDYIQIAVHRAGHSGAERVPVLTPKLEGLPSEAAQWLARRVPHSECR